MPLYVDTSALLKRYLEEPDSEAADAILAEDVAWFSGRHTCDPSRPGSRLHIRPLEVELGEVFDETFREAVERVRPVLGVGIGPRLATEVADGMDRAGILRCV